MPRYIITLGCTGNPFRKVSRALECQDQRGAIAVAKNRLKYAQGATVRGEQFDYWQVLLHAKGSVRPVIIASGKAED